MDIIDYYQKGYSYKELSTIFNCSQKYIWRTIKKSNIKMRGSGNSKPQKINPFTILNKETQYWLGYIMADGTIIYNNRSYSVALYSKNKEILEKYNSFTNNMCRIFICNKQNIYSAVIYSKVICDFLINNYNIVPNKSKILNTKLEITWIY